MTTWEPTTARVRSDADGTTYEIEHSDGTRARIRFRATGVVHFALLDGRWGIVRAGPSANESATAIDLERLADEGR